MLNYEGLERQRNNSTIFVYIGLTLCWPNYFNKVTFSGPILWKLLSNSQIVLGDFLYILFIKSKKSSISFV